ncbi:MAG: S41 family peptidase [Chloroflexi bacterium]|nr:S41 family peptidase [Chloroflexota bacterium]
MERVGRVLASVLFVVAVAVTSFYFGYTLPRPAGRPVLPTPTPAASEPADQAARERFAVFWEAWNIVEREFYNRQGVDYDKMTYGAIKGMLASLDDPHTAFATPSQARVSEDDMRGTFYGVGIQVEMKDGKLVVVAPVDDTPAQRAGVRPGDVIVAVDGRPLTGVTLTDAVTLIRGPRGSHVQLTIERAGGQALSFDLVRAEIRMVTVKTEMLDGRIAYIKLNSFSATASGDLQRVLRTVLRDRVAGIIFDLRNNPGGLLQAAVDVASQFLRDGVVLYEERRDGRFDPFYVKPGGLAPDVPMVVLVNKGSASASEIVAGALQDRGRALLIGEQTYGKSSVQNVHRLSDSSSVRVTFAQWWTPNRQDLNRKGLAPDLVVPLTDEDRTADRDPQLQAATLHLQQVTTTGAAATR